jgi:glyoxylase-like metal-dependent hydrolase (beta-lactamase superfamily II)
VQPIIESFLDIPTSTFSHVVYDREGGRAAIIDPVLGFDPTSGKTSLAPIAPILALIKAQGLEVEWILETHAHADHLSAAPPLKDALGGKIGIGARIIEVQNTFGRLLNLGPDFARDGSQFDHLFADGENFMVGALRACALDMPGHTPADMAFVIGEHIFVGDTLFMPDVGTARCDFPGGDAPALYRSIKRLLAFSPSTRLYLCHDYPPSGRAPCAFTTVAEERHANIHVNDAVSLEQFVSMRENRDKTLAMPQLMWPAIQVNIRAGQLPQPEHNGSRYLKLPIDAPAS